MATPTDPALGFAIPPQAAAGVTIGLSGGLDSTVLAHALAHMSGIGPLRALHIHHGLHRDADAWADASRRTAQALGIALDVVQVRVAKRGQGLEAAARQARIDAFQAHLHDGEVLALAHHRDDQAETFLLRALRASGPEGLAAMRVLRPFGQGFLWRPLLDMPRVQLRVYADAHGLAWIDDPANDSLEHDRNFLRHRVLPLLRERWPHADAAFARAAMLSAEASDLLAGEDARALDAARTDDPAILSASVLRALDPTRRARVLRRWILERHAPPLPAEGIAQLDADLMAGAPDADFRFAWTDVELRRWCDLLRLAKRAPDADARWSDTWDGRLPLILPDGGTLALEGTDAFDAPVRVRLRQGGERIVLPNRTHSHALKHALQDAEMPTWDRERLPLLVDAEHRVLAAGDQLLAADFANWLRARGATLRWSPPPSH